ncbi:MAG: response regulator [Gammaproteobacteria bacterium]|nr:response regulator [Gammaproteobacteria bacterium]
MNEPEKILIVDDVTANVDLLEALLSAKFSFNILKAYGGKEGLDLAQKEHPNLILLDIMMPDLNGFQVCEMLRQDATFVATPIIMVTARAQEDDIIKALEKGADDYIIKPVNGEDLCNKVGGLLVKAKKGTLPSQYYSEIRKARKEGNVKGMSDYARILNLED